MPFVNQYGMKVKADTAVIKITEDELQELIEEALRKLLPITGRLVVNVDHAMNNDTVLIDVDGSDQDVIQQLHDHHFVPHHTLTFTANVIKMLFTDDCGARYDDETDDVWISVPFDTYIKLTLDL